MMQNSQIVNALEHMPRSFRLLGDTDTLKVFKQEEENRAVH